MSTTVITIYISLALWQIISHFTTEYFVSFQIQFVPRVHPNMIPQTYPNVKN